MNEGSLVVHLASVLSSDFDQLADLRVAAMKESPSNRFYKRHGFTPVSESEWDIYYIRASEVASSG